MRKTLTAMTLACAAFASPHAHATDWSAWNVAEKQAINQCMSAAPKQRGYMVWRANCINQVAETYEIPRAGADADLVRLMNAYRVSVAARVDRGEISVEDGALLVAQKNSEIKTAALNRTAVNAQAQAADRESRAAQAQMYLGILRSMQGPPTVTCSSTANAIGNSAFGTTTCR